MINIEKMIRFEEGLKLQAYLCSEGFLTCGIGHNLESDPALDILKRQVKLNEKITEQESQSLFSRDLQRTAIQIKKNIKNFDKLDKNYQAVLINMGFQMGVTRLLQFKNMLAAMAKDDKAKVVASMKDSLWFKQTPNRANRLIDVVNGKIPSEYV